MFRAVSLSLFLSLSLSLSLCLSLSLSLSLSVPLSLCLSLPLSLSLSLPLSVSLSVCLSVCLSVVFSIFLPIHPCIGPNRSNVNYRDECEENRLKRSAFVPCTYAGTTAGPLPRIRCGLLALPRPGLELPPAGSGPSEVPGPDWLLQGCDAAGKTGVTSRPPHPRQNRTA